MTTRYKIELKIKIKHAQGGENAIKPASVKLKYQEKSCSAILGIYNYNIPS